MSVLIWANEPTALLRRVYFFLVGTDGITPANGEAGQQPQISIGGGAWTSTGIGTLNLIGRGRYYADLTQNAVQFAGSSIETTYKSVNTAECPGDSVRVVAFNPHDSVSLGLSRVRSDVVSVNGDPNFGYLLSRLIKDRAHYAVLSATSSTVVLADHATVPAGWYPPGTVVIVRGDYLEGPPEFRQLVSYNGNGLCVITPNWSAVPDVDMEVTLVLEGVAGSGGGEGNDESFEVREESFIVR